MKINQPINIILFLILGYVPSFSQESFLLRTPQKIKSDGEQYYNYEIYTVKSKSCKNVLLNATEASNSCFGSNQYIITDFNGIQTFSLSGKLTSSKKVNDPLLIIGSTISFNNKDLVLLMTNNQTNKFSIWEYSLSNYSLKKLVDNLTLNISLEALKVKIKPFKNNRLLIEGSDLSMSEIDLDSKNVAKKIKLVNDSEEQCAYTFLSFQGETELYFTYSNDCKSYNLLKKSSDNKDVSILKNPITHSGFPIMLNNVEKDAILIFTGKETFAYKQSGLVKRTNINPKNILYFDNSNIIIKNSKGIVELVKY